MLETDIAITLSQKYTSGIRQFAKAQLEQSDLEDVFLSRANFQAANFNQANLKNADLSDVNLAGASLISANLTQAHLSRVDFTNAQLKNADLTKAILTKANFTGAFLQKTCFVSTILFETNFSGADLSGANLSEVDLGNVNLEGAIWNNETIFPADFDPVKSGMLRDCKIEDLIEQLNYLGECSNKYLGNMMTTRYLNSSRPKVKWLKQFEVSKTNQITLIKDIADEITPQQLNEFQHWIDAFTKSCSGIIKDFCEMI